MFVLRRFICGYVARLRYFRTHVLPVCLWHQGLDWRFPSRWPKCTYSNIQHYLQINLTEQDFSSSIFCSCKFCWSAFGLSFRVNVSYFHYSSIAILFPAMSFSHGSPSYICLFSLFHVSVWLLHLFVLNIWSMPTRNFLPLEFVLVQKMLNI